MTASNYPPGVTGSEYAIGGAEQEWDEQRYCPDCEEDVTFAMQLYDGAQWGEDEAGHCIEDEDEG